MKTVQQVMDELHFKSIASVAQVLLKKFPKYRQNKIKSRTLLSPSEIEILRNFKASHRKVTSTRRGLEKENAACL